jgi:hypothetical protein
MAHVRRNGIWAAGLAVALLAAAPAGARTEHLVTITANGTGTALVHPSNRKSNTSIVAAVKKAQKIANERAFEDAREYAHDFAKEAGRKIIRLVSISDVQANIGYYGGGYGGGSDSGPFGPNKYCGVVRVRVGKFVRGQRPTFKKERRCFVPRRAYKTLTLTYLAK